MRRAAKAFAAISLMSLSPVAAPFQAPAALAQPAPKDGWSFRIGGFGFLAPDYIGSDDYEVSGAPDLSITYSTWFFAGREGIGVNLVNDGTFRVGVALGAGGGRDEGDNRALRGLGDIDTTLEGKLLLGWSSGKFDVSLDLARDLLRDGGHGGTTANLSARYGFLVGQRLSVFAGPSVTWASESWTQSFFGITPSQAARSGQRAYRAGSGVSEFGVSALAVYGLSRNWSVTGLAGYSRLTGDAEDSPLVDRDGDANQWSLGIGLSYRF